MECAYFLLIYHLFEGILFIKTYEDEGKYFSLSKKVSQSLQSRACDCKKELVEGDQILCLKSETPFRGLCLNTYFPVGASVKEGSGNSEQ